MTANEFRRIALSMRDAIEASHMGHPDFRVNGRIFATLKGDDKFGMVSLRPEDQQRFIREDPGAFSPESGAWGLQGCTRVRLATVDEDMLGEAMTLAWQQTVEKAKAPKKRKRAEPRTRTKNKRT